MKVEALYPPSSKFQAKGGAVHYVQAASKNQKGTNVILEVERPFSNEMNGAILIGQAEKVKAAVTGRGLMHHNAHGSLW